MPPLPPALAICFQRTNSYTRWRCYFKGLSQDGERFDSSVNLSASLLNEDLSNGPEPSRWTVPLTGVFFVCSVTNSRGCPGGNRENAPDCTARQDYAHHSFSVEPKNPRNIFRDFSHTWKIIVRKPS